MSEKVVALIPMRHSSERVPGKNYRSFAGRPLYHHVVSSLLACHFVDEVMINTDSPRIMNEAPTAFPSVRIIERPERLRGGEVAMNDILRHDVTRAEADVYLQTHSTNPLLRSSTITRALEAFLDGRDDHDSLFSVTRLHTRLYDQHGAPMNHDLEVLRRTQDLPPVFEENSNLYVFTRESLEKTGNRIGEHPILFEIEREEAWDIDEELDFLIAEFLYQRRARGR